MTETVSQISTGACPRCGGAILWTRKPNLPDEWHRPLDAEKVSSGYTIIQGAAYFVYTHPLHVCVVEPLPADLWQVQNAASNAAAILRRTENAAEPSPRDEPVREPEMASDVEDEPIMSDPLPDKPGWRNRACPKCLVPAGEMCLNLGHDRDVRRFKSSPHPQREYADPGPVTPATEQQLGTRAAEVEKKRERYAADWELALLVSCPVCLATENQHCRNMSTEWGGRDEGNASPHIARIRQAKKRATA